MIERLSYKLIACDLDGTLLNDAKELTPENIEAIKSLTAAGIHFVPCTGRTYGEIPVEVRENPDINYIIYSSGAAVLEKSTGKIYDAYFPRELSCEIFDLLCEYDTEMMVHSNGDSHVNAATADVKVYSEHFHMPRSFCELIPATNVHVENFSDFVHESNTVEMFCCFFANEAELLECRERLSKYKDIIIAASDPNNLEIGYISANKGDAMLRLAELLGIKRVDTVAVGDSKNDMTMLERAGLALAPDNAWGELKEIADAVICSNNEHVAAYLADAFLNTDGDEDRDTVSENESEAQDPDAPVISYKKLAIASAILATAIAVFVIISAIVGFFGGSYRRVGYYGSQTWDTWSGTYVLLDGEMTHVVRCDSGTLHISVETEEGKIGIEMTDADGKTVFDKDDIGTGSFTVDVSGKVYIKITAEDHKGNFVIGD